MKKRIVALFLGAGASAALMGGLMTGDGPQGAKAVDPDVRIHEVAADYPSFDNLGALDARSSAVVRGTVHEVGPAYRVVPAEVPLDQLPPHKREQVGVVQHDVVVRIDKVLSRGSSDMTGALVKVTHLGGRIGADSYEVHEEPASEVGKSYVLFLQRFGSGKFGIVGGPQGRYVVKGDGRLSSLNDEARTRGVGKQLHGLRANELETRYSANAAKPPVPGPSARDEAAKPSNVPAKP